MSIQWTEVNAEMPTFSIVGRNDDLPQNPGEAGAAVVAFLAATASSAAVNRLIQQELQRLIPIVQRLLPLGSDLGVLAVAQVEVANYGELRGQNLRGCSISGGASTDARRALRHYMNQPRLEPGARSRIGRITRRFFWGTRMT